MIDFMGLAASAIPAAIETLGFIRCDACRSREACEREHRCRIVEGEHKPSSAFIDYPRDWRADARRMGK